MRAISTCSSWIGYLEHAVACVLVLRKRALWIAVIVSRCAIPGYTCARRDLCHEVGSTSNNDAQITSTNYVDPGGTPASLAQRNVIINMRATWLTTFTLSTTHGSTTSSTPSPCSAVQAGRYEHVMPGHRMPDCINTLTAEEAGRHRHGRVTSQIRMQACSLPLARSLRGRRPTAF